MQKTDALIIGGGLVGLAIAYGMARSGRQVRVLDEGDSALRAARGNFGLLWVQGKGYGKSAYAQWTRQSVALWPQLAAYLREDSGVDVCLQQAGGFQLCLSEAEMDEEGRRLSWLHQALDGDYPFELLSPGELRKRLPGVGPEVVGACYSPMDGQVNPLKLLRALYAACRRQGVQIDNGHRVDAIRPVGEGLEVRAGDQRWQAGQLVLAAGLGNRPLGALLGADVPVRPNRGQILVTERLAPFLHYPTTYVRQTDEGTVQLGDSMEAVGYDDRGSADVMADIARRGVRCFPLLADVRLVRAWGALRVLSPDGLPIYQALPECPQVWVASCHSGVTLAAAHALLLAPWLSGQGHLPGVQPFGLSRFQSASEVQHAG